jgi:hypothetical protein
MPCLSDPAPQWIASFQNSHNGALRPRLDHSCRLGYLFGPLPPQRIWRVQAASATFDASFALQMYNDIAHDPSNPVPGQVFNRPGGPDVYRGVHIDYEGEAVNVQVGYKAHELSALLARMMLCPWEANAQIIVCSSHVDVRSRACAELPGSAGRGQGSCQGRGVWEGTGGAGALYA